MDNVLVKDPDGKYKEQLDDKWLVEYSEDPQNGLWKVEIFHHDVSEWVSTEYTSLEEAQQAAYNFYDQL